MDYDALLAQVLDLLQREQRLSYRVLKLRLQLDDALLEALKEDLIYAKKLAVDEDGRVLVWTGGTSIAPPTTSPVPPSARPEVSPAQGETAPIIPPRPEAERRQLTVMFCDLVDSTRLSSQLDPEEYRDVVWAYHTACTEIIRRYDGHIAQLLGDGLLVYFGYPQAHEDDAQRAVRAGLGIIEALGPLNTRLAQERGVRLAVRLGIHTGLVVVGEVGGDGRHEHLALGDTPNLAARLQGLAAPDTIVISEATSRLVQGYFTCQDGGVHVLKGIDTPMRVWQVVGESAAQSRLDVAGATGLTPLVGREAEVTLLRERWAQSQDGHGQVVVLSGEAGIGKSRLVQVLTERVVDTGAPRLTLRCSPYHTNSAFYPVIAHLQRVLHWHREPLPEARLAALEQAVHGARLPLGEVVPLVATLLSLPVPERYPPLTLSPPRQKQKTQEALVAWLLAEAEQQPVLVVWEDLHWADPSTLELLGLLQDQVPTTRLLMVLTCRPELRLPWAPHSYVTPLSLTRLTRPQVEEMILRVTGGKPLPAAVVQQMVAKTDGIPLFVEELVKTVLESGLLQEEADRYILTGSLSLLAIPATLQDALVARLDRLAEGKMVAQLGAVLGRTFAYALLQAVAALDELVLWRGLGQLVQAEVLYQRGVPPHATYTFKHALVQEAAYQSLLRSTRQQYHQRTAQVLMAHFPDLAETQPELLAQHFTEAGLIAQALPYWQRAGERATQRSANQEAIRHLTHGLELLATLPDTPARSQQELTLQTMLGTALVAIKGYNAPEVGQAYTRAYALCQQLGETLHVFPVLAGLRRFYTLRGEFPTGHELAEQLLVLAHHVHKPVFLVEAHFAMGNNALFSGDVVCAHTHFEQGIPLYNALPQRSHIPLYAQDSGVSCLAYAAMTAWLLGYPDQARRRSQEALALAQELAHPYTLVFALGWAGIIHQFRREAQATYEQAEASDRRGSPLCITTTSEA